MTNSYNIISFGKKPRWEFPTEEEVCQISGFTKNSVAFIEDSLTKLPYMYTRNLGQWTLISEAYSTNYRIEHQRMENEHLRKERDAAIADLTELCMFYKTQTICNFCAYDDDEECKGRGGDNDYMNKCFKWRGPV